MEIGTTCRGRDIEQYSHTKYGGNSLYIWRKCLGCGKQNWTLCVKGKPLHNYCQKCAGIVRCSGKGNKHPRWKGGRFVDKEGYIIVYIDDDDFFRSMATDRNYILEHRLIMAKHLNRCLLPWEIVHHRNGIRSDNHIENLQLLPSKVYHVVDTQIKGRVKSLEKRIIELEAEVTLLKYQLANSRTDVAAI